MGGQGRPGLGAGAGDHIQRARRQTRLDGQLGQAQDGKAGILGGFQHHRVAHGQRRAADPPEHLGGRIPRDDPAHHAQGFAKGQCRGPRIQRYLVAAELVDDAAVVFEIAGKDRHVEPRRFHQLADIARVKLGQRLVLAQDQRGHPGQNAAPFFRFGPGPGAGVEGRARAADGKVDVGGIALGDAGKDRAVRGAHHIAQPPGDRCDEPAVDEVHAIHVQPLCLSIGVNGPPRT